MNTNKINRSTINLIKEFEGCELVAYRDPVGILTIGYGYTNNAGFGPGVDEGHVWGQAQANKWLARGLEVFGEGVQALLTRPATNNQFGAMVSLAYNIGLTAFGKSTCLRKFNKGDFEGASDAMTWFNKAGGKRMRGLVRRREAERNLFLSDLAEAKITRPVDNEKSKLKSKTIQAAVLGGAGHIGYGINAVSNLETIAQVIMVIGFCLTGILITGIIIMERMNKDW